MKRTRLKKIGRVGRANIESRNKIAEIAEEKGLNYCEIRLGGCLKNLYLAPAHRNKRVWYKGNAELLADYSQWVAACVNCHNFIEHDKALTEETFNRLRPATPKKVI